MADELPIDLDEVARIMGQRELTILGLRSQVRALQARLEAERSQPQKAQDGESEGNG